VRVFGILLIFLAGPAVASEAGDSPGLARFAYAKSQAFLNTLTPRVASVGWPASRTRFVRGPAPLRLHVLTVAAAKHLAGYADSLPPVLVAARTDAAPLEVTLPDLHPTPPRIASPLHSVSVPPVIFAAAPTTATREAAPTERLASLSALPVSEAGPMELAPAQPRPASLQAATAMIAVTEPAFAPAVEPPEKHPSAERMASLSDPAMPAPMRLLPKAERKDPTDKQAKRRRAKAKIKTKVTAKVRAKARTKAKSTVRTVQAKPAYAQRPEPAMTRRVYRPTMAADDTTAERAIPRWAAKMYDSSWQQHAFTYR
jgi:uncharacterized protein YqiB (DUF1249 family)